jgi:iron complex outermembrane receptor protein
MFFQKALLGAIASISLSAAFAQDSSQPKGLTLQSIEIKTVRAGERTPFTQTMVFKSSIEKSNLGQDIPFLLNQTPSVVVHSDAGNGVGYTGIRIRGTDPTRINITLNGIPYNDAESQGVFFVNLPDFASSVSSIQIQRGVGTSSSGTGSFGASVNMSTQDTRTQPYAEIQNSGGSFNTWKNTVSAGTGLIGNHFSLDARLSRIVSDGFIDRASSNLQSFFLSGSWIGNRSSLRANVFSGKEKTYQAWYGIPQEFLESNRTFNSAGTEKPGSPYENETDNYQQTHYQLFYNRSLGSGLNLQTAAFYTRGLGYYEQYKAGAAYADYGLKPPVVGGDTLEQTDLIRQLWLDNHYYGLNLSLQYKDEHKEIIAGGGGSQYLGQHYGKIIWASSGGIENNQRWYNLDALKNEASAFVKWQQELKERWTLFADIQYRYVRYDLNGFRNNPDLRVSNTWNFVNPKAGVRYRLANGHAYLSVAIANKEPNRDDFEAGLQNQPRPERMQNLELGVEKRKGNFSWSVTGYFMNYRDQLVLTGAINDVGAYARTNIPESYRLGLELQGGWKAANWFNALANLTLSRNRIRNFTAYTDNYDQGGQKTEFFENTDISFSPTLTSAATLNLIPMKNLEITLLPKYVSRQYLDNTSRKSRSLDPYFVQDLRVIYKIPQAWIREAGLTLQVNNLLNARYEPNGYSFSYILNGETIAANYYYPMAGINFMAGLLLKM